MKFKKLKYNLICLVMVLLVTSAVLLKVYFVDEQIPDSNIDITIPNDPNDASNNNENDDPDAILPIDDTRDPNIPSAAYPTNVLNYCLNKLATSNGYKSKISLVTKISASQGSLSGNTEHLSEGTIIVSGKQMMESMRFTPKDNLSKSFSNLNGLITTYYDGQKSHVWRTPEGSFDISEARYWNVDGILNQGQERFYYNRLYPNNVKFDKKGVTCKLSTQKNSSTGREEYLISVKLENIAYYPEQFARSYNSFHWFLNPESITSTIVFTIDKKTGWIKKYVQQDNFSGTCTALEGYPIVNNAKVSLSFTYSQTFSNHNQALSINHPTIPPEPPKQEQ